MPPLTKGLARCPIRPCNNAAVQFNLLLARQAPSAMRDARFRDAIDAFQEAVKLAPANIDAAAALRAAELAYENRAAYIAAMNRGNLALNNLLYTNAVAAFTDALRVWSPMISWPPSACKLPRRALADYCARLADANLLIQAGSAAANQRKYADAAKAFKEALRILPTHPQADTVAALFRYNDNMADGNRAMDARRYPDAIRHFQAALLEAPNDANAMMALNQARAMNKKN